MQVGSSTQTHGSNYPDINIGNNQFFYAIGTPSKIEELVLRTPILQSCNANIRQTTLEGQVVLAIPKEYLSQKIKEIAREVGVRLA